MRIHSRRRLPPALLTCGHHPAHLLHDRRPHIAQAGGRRRAQGRRAGASLSGLGDEGVEEAGGGRLVVDGFAERQQQAQARLRVRLRAGRVDAVGQARDQLHHLKRLFPPRVERHVVEQPRGRQPHLSPARPG